MLWFHDYWKEPSTNSAFLLKICKVALNHSIPRSQLLLRIDTVIKEVIKNDFIFIYKEITDVPGKPGKPELVDSDKDHIKIKWSAPISNGGSPIIGYDVERRDRATGRWVKLNKEPTRNTEYYDDRVQDGHQYEYRVSAVNAAGAGKPSDTSNVFTAKPMKGKYKIKCNCPF